jgi:uncharacterized membrane protein
MDIEFVSNLFFICLLIVVVISFFVGYGFMKKSKNHKTGFLTLFGISFLLLIILFKWYQSVAVELYIGTIPFLFNQAFAIVLYLIYLIIIWFVLKRLNKRNLLNKSS